MLIRKNTKAYKTIVAIISDCQNRADRERLIRLYITKAGHSVNDRISVEGIQGEAGLFYEMNYQAVLNNLKSSNHQLHQSDEIPGLYFFHSTPNKAWDETPFEFDETVRDEFASLPELPLVRKKEKAQKFVLPVAKIKTESKAEAKPGKKEAAKKTDKAPVVQREDTKQPAYKLRHKIHFTDLDKIAFRQPHLTRKDVLDYYNKISEHLLPYLKDRPQLIRLHGDGAGNPGYSDAEALAQDGKLELPDWLQTVTVTEGKTQKQLLLCNDKEHLLFYAGIGCLAFNPCHVRAKSLDSPDYLLIVMDSPEASIAKTIDVALTAREILTGLQLPSLVKTDGMSGLHVYVPLDAKSEFEAAKNAGEYICRLIRLKIPDLVTVSGVDEYSYGKVSLDHQLNEAGKSVISPYSLVPGTPATVATPLLWEEVKDGLRAEDHNHSTIFQRLKEGDPFEALSKKKVNAADLFERLERGYGFLLTSSWPSPGRRREEGK